MIQVYSGRETKKVLREGLRFAQQSSDASESSAFAAFGETLRAAIEARMGGITMSFGVSTWHGAGDTMHSLMERADRALYCSKEKGRNSVSTEGEAACCDICANAEKHS